MTTLDLSQFRTTCPRCGAPVVHAASPAGLPLPIDLEPNPTRGNILLSIHRGRLHAGPLGRNQAAGAREAGQPLHSTHVTDCVPGRHGRTRR